MLTYPIIIILSLLYQLGISSNPEDSLPIYLRGLKWDTVEEFLKEDLRLSGDVVPSNYAIELTVNVRGTEQAEKSDFNGTVAIYLDIIKPTDKIELHSNGLTILKAELMESEIMSEPIRVVNVTSNPERETITILANRTIQTQENMMLQITYHGVAIMDGNGLYENWDPKFNNSLDNNGPFILASNNFPTGARFWFPCFDEPDKKATFDLQVNHPNRLNAYANSDIERREDLGNGRTLSTFKKTRPMSTYQVALSVNHYSSQRIEVAGFNRIRLIRSANSHDNWTDHPLSHRGLTMDVPALIKSNLDQLSAFEFGKLPEHKLDIILLEGTNLNTIQPGLITIGRRSLFDSVTFKPFLDFRDLVQLRIGTQTSVENSNQIWLHTMFSHLGYNDTFWTHNFFNLNNFAHETLYASVHERPLRAELLHATSTKLYLASKLDLPARKEFVANSIGKFSTIDDFIEAVSRSCDDSDVARRFLSDFIDQPGKVLLTVHKNNDSVEIRQTRFHSTYFDPKLRDTKTRFTIPILYTIDGKQGVKIFDKNASSVTVNVPSDSIFLIDPEYDQIYLVFYEHSLLPAERNVTEGERRNVVSALEKSILAAASIGYVKHEHRLLHGVRGLVKAPFESTYFDKPDQFSIDQCAADWDNNGSNWAGTFLNETVYWRKPTDFGDALKYVHCTKEWSNSTTYTSFLEKNFLGKDTVIRPEMISFLALREQFTSMYWRDLHRFLFRHAGNASNRRFALLADTVLNSVKMYGNIRDNAYPETDMREDYLSELRAFVLRSPRQAASMSTEIEMRLEREFVKAELHKFHDYDDTDYGKNLYRLLQKTRNY